jgi:hypothetical protein
MKSSQKIRRRIGHCVPDAPLSSMLAPWMRSEGGERPPSEWWWRLLHFGRRDALPVAPAVEEFAV